MNAKSKVAIEVDQVIALGDFESTYKFGPVREGIRQVLHDLRSAGAKICIWSVRTNGQLQSENTSELSRRLQDWLVDNQIPHDEIAVGGKPLAGAYVGPECIEFSEQRFKRDPDELREEILAKVAPYIHGSVPDHLRDSIDSTFGDRVARALVRVTGMDMQFAEFLTRQAPDLHDAEAYFAGVLKDEKYTDQQIQAFASHYRRYVEEEALKGDIQRATGSKRVYALTYVQAMRDGLGVERARQLAAEATSEPKETDDGAGQADDDAGQDGDSAGSPGEADPGEGGEADSGGAGSAEGVAGGVQTPSTEAKPPQGKGADGGRGSKKSR